MAVGFNGKGGEVQVRYDIEGKVSRSYWKHLRPVSADGGGGACEVRRDCAGRIIHRPDVYRKAVDKSLYSEVSVDGALCYVCEKR